MVEARSICIVTWPKICARLEKFDINISNPYQNKKIYLPVLHKGHLIRK
jgi:hypothetical protein